MRRQPTGAQKAAALERRRKLGELARKVRALSDNERAAWVARAGIRTCEGHELSPFNQVFLAMQCNGTVPTLVGGFRQWRRVGRCVRRGEHAVGSIYVPLPAQEQSESVEPEEAADEHQRFVLVSVFDVTQTDPAQASETD